MADISLLLCSVHDVLYLHEQRVFPVDFHLPQVTAGSLISHELLLDQLLMRSLRILQLVYHTLFFVLKCIQLFVSLLHIVAHSLDCSLNVLWVVCIGHELLSPYLCLCLSDRLQPFSILKLHLLCQLYLIVHLPLYTDKHLVIQLFQLDLLLPLALLLPD